MLVPPPLLIGAGAPLPCAAAVALLNGTNKHYTLTIVSLEHAIVSVHVVLDLLGALVV